MYTTKARFTTIRIKNRMSMYLLQITLFSYTKMHIWDQCLRKEF